MKFVRKISVVLMIIAVAALRLHADTASLLILHTNDMHDYIKPGPNNCGGVPYLAGYIASMRAQRNDIVLLDGGDVMEKGDMVAFVTESRVMYEAMKKMGYTAGAIGNHDLDHGVPYMKECSALAGYPLLCLNHFDADGSLSFPASTVVEVNGIKVGILGMTNIRGAIKKDGAHLAAEAKRLDEEADLLVVVAHIGSKECALLSAMAPEIDLFVSAHTHEVIKTPVVVPDTQALIVQAGQYAQYIGKLEVTVDLDSNKIVNYDGTLIPMSHDAITPDAAMLEWIAKMEKEHCPEAAETVGQASRFINVEETAALAAAALKEYGHVDVAFCHSSQVMRSGVYAGDVDANALFRTGGQRGADLVAFNLTGAQIEAYLTGLVQEKRGKTEWAGFKATMTFDGGTRLWSIASSLDKEKVYTAIMTEREWTQRFLRIAKESDAFKDFNPSEMKPAEFTFTPALTAYAKSITAGGETLDNHAETLISNRKM